VGAVDLTARHRAIIGTGIFVIIGEAIAESGPAIVISFVLRRVTCIFSALAYAELASTLPVSASAYTYAYATMGELLAWIIGVGPDPRADPRGVRDVPRRADARAPCDRLGEDAHATSARCSRSSS
jgi:hypothetical protein